MVDDVPNGDRSADRSYHGAGGSCGFEQVFVGEVCSAFGLMVIVLVEQISATPLR